MPYDPANYSKGKPQFFCHVCGGAIWGQPIYWKAVSTVGFTGEAKGGMKYAYCGAQCSMDDYQGVTRTY